MMGLKTTNPYRIEIGSLPPPWFQRALADGRITPLGNRGVNDWGRAGIRGPDGKVWPLGSVVTEQEVLGQ